MNKNYVIAIIVIAVLVIAAGFLYNKFRVAPEIDFDKLELTDLDGKAVNFRSFANKKLFLNFFATWCSPCVRELPSLQNAQSMLQNGNFQVICISDEPLAELKQFRDDKQVNLLILHSIKKMKDLNIVTYPTSYLLNAKREVVFKDTGERDWSNSENLEALKRSSK